MKTKLTNKARVAVLADALRRIAANRGEAQAARTAAFALQRVEGKP